MFTMKLLGAAVPKVFRKHCPKEQASEAFEWAVILVAVVLVRAIKAQRC